MTNKNDYLTIEQRKKIIADNLNLVLPGHNFRVTELSDTDINVEWNGDVPKEHVAYWINFMSVNPYDFEFEVPDLDGEIGL